MGFISLGVAVMFGVASGEGMSEPHRRSNAPWVTCCSQKAVHHGD